MRRRRIEENANTMLDNESVRPKNESKVRRLAR